MNLLEWESCPVCGANDTTYRRMLGSQDPGEWTCEECGLEWVEGEDREAVAKRVHKIRAEIHKLRAKYHDAIVKDLEAKQ